MVQTVFILAENVLHSANPLMERRFIHGGFDFFSELSRSLIEFLIVNPLVTKPLSQGKQWGYHCHKGGYFRLIGKLFLQILYITQKMGITVLNLTRSLVVGRVPICDENPGRGSLPKTAWGTLAERFLPNWKMLRFGVANSHT